MTTSIHCMFGRAAVATFENHNAFGSNIWAEHFSSTDLTNLGNGVPEWAQAGKAQPGTAAAVLDWGAQSGLDLATNIMLQYVMTILEQITLIIKRHHIHEHVSSWTWWTWKFHQTNVFYASTGPRYCSRLSSSWRPTPTSVSLMRPTMCVAIQGIGSAASKQKTIHGIVVTSC